MRNGFGHGGSPEMMIVMRASASPEDVRHIIGLIEEAGGAAHVSEDRETTVIGAIGERSQIAILPLEGLPGVDQVLPLRKAYKWVSREFFARDTVTEVGGRRAGGGEFMLIAGPCSVESREQTLEAARACADAGTSVLRGGAFKPRSSPYAFQGLGLAALEILADARRETGLPVATELMDPRDLDAVYEHVDLIWIGARNMQNFNLLSEIGKIDKPVMLKRGISATVEELLMAAEYVAKEGNERIILCERGIRTFERSTRFTLDVGAIPVLKSETHLPVIVDPSHAAGKRQLVAPLARAAVAAGADGLIVETHPNPEHALSDAAQQIPSAHFGDFVREIEACLAVTGKRLSTGAA
jgi:3-deoxy-7-phosphoheptulonate synthase